MPAKTKRNNSEARKARFPSWIVILVALTVVITGGVIYYLFRPLEAPIPDDLGTQYAGLERSVTEQGFARLGQPDAPVIVEDFSSYACPHCRDFHTDIFPGLLDKIAAGDVQFIMVPVPHIGSGASSAAKGALCAGEQGQFWEMHDVLFDWQERFLISTFDERRIRKGAEAMGLDIDVFEQCMASTTVETIVNTARSEFDRRGLRGTPSFFINGQPVTDYAEFENLGDRTG